jgi:hypothetical protein
VPHTRAASEAALATERDAVLLLASGGTQRRSLHRRCRRQWPPSPAGRAKRRAGGEAPGCPGPNGCRAGVEGTDHRVPLLAACTDHTARVAPSLDKGKPGQMTPLVMKQPSGVTSTTWLLSEGAQRSCGRLRCRPGPSVPLAHCCSHRTISVPGPEPAMIARAAPRSALSRTLVSRVEMPVAEWRRDSRCSDKSRGRGRVSERRRASHGSSPSRRRSSRAMLRPPRSAGRPRRPPRRPPGSSTERGR